MRKRIAVALTAFIVAVGLTACHMPTELERHPVDKRHTESGTKIETKHIYKYNVLKGEFVLVPDIQEINTPEKWEILWRITYDDGTCVDKWLECTQAEYEKEG